MFYYVGSDINNIGHTMSSIWTQNRLRQFHHQTCSFSPTCPTPLFRKMYKEQWFSRAGGEMPTLSVHKKNKKQYCCYFDICEAGKVLHLQCFVATGCVWGCTFYKRIFHNSSFVLVEKAQVQSYWKGLFRPAKCKSFDHSDAQYFEDFHLYPLSSRTFVLVIFVREG